MSRTLTRDASGQGARRASAALRAGGLLAASALMIASGWAGAQEREREREHGAEVRPIGRQGEPHPGPSGYQRPAEPPGWNARPPAADRGFYQHNFQAARSFHIGPYHRPPGWVDRRWAYGQILPRTFWGAQYILADYWLFGLEVPPAGYEWVRYGPDALLINIENGEILQAEYGVFG
jgi:Ni/Co efflux regulator RcnB